jgi:iron complex transport system substrate-binding protein
MRRFWPLLLFVALFVVIWFSVRPVSQQALQLHSDTDYQRLVSLSPGITETVFALGLGDKLVAVSDFSDYPPQAEKLPTVGGYTDVSLEAIVSQKPDLVILPQGQQRLEQQLSGLGIKTHQVNYSSLLGIEAGIASIGQITGHGQQAEKLLSKIHQQIQNITAKTASLKPVNTLISMAHYVNSDQLETVYIAGQQDFYNDLLQLAGGRNVYTGNRVRVPTVTPEGIMRMNPDVIIDVFPEADDHHSDMNLVRQQWQQLDAVSAVKHDRVYIVETDFASVPGPRVFKLLPIFAQLLHPQLHWKNADADD